ncbi:hypothetical protein T440DRAFT_490581 [Plenodomus tracheiphilus IPT5]|uniref:Transcription factor domain-containing protein n=1 Tax=Plenodomus tracheiphilus IPT5 TaxID=1408161 RepID=A0A6A7B234_9PLEO|nr:hypothetical protein T440DRAFT_490581 [Plenodomus tracheiphilus IPT5]
MYAQLVSQNDWLLNMAASSHQSQSWEAADPESPAASFAIGWIPLQILGAWNALCLHVYSVGAGMSSATRPSPCAIDADEMEKNERARQTSDTEPTNVEPYISAGSSTTSDKTSPTITPGNHVDTAIHMLNSQFAQPGSMAFQISENRLLELFFDNFWPSFPCVLPYDFLQARLLKDDHGMHTLLPVLHWIGSIYAPWTVSEPYFEIAVAAIRTSTLAQTPFNVQALMLYAIALYHYDVKPDGREKMDAAVAMALQLHMNEQWFAHAYGEGDSVLEESWRRTFYLLKVADQHFSVTSNTPMYTLLTVPSNVDLPCDDEFFESGQIPPVVTWAEFENREFADVQVVYSSLVYLYDIAMVVAYIMQSFLATGSFTEAIIDGTDAKLAIWISLLPDSKRDPMRSDGRIDEVMFMAHMCLAITMSTVHRPCSSLAYSSAEMLTSAFLSPSPFIIPTKTGRGAHTARALKASEIFTKLLAIPCAVEKHNVFAASIIAQLAAVQVSASNVLLDDYPQSIARDRIKLAIGCLNNMGTLWPLAKRMAKEVRMIARADLASMERTAVDPATAATSTSADARDEIIWTIDPMVGVNIYSGVILPNEWSLSDLSQPPSAYSNAM